MASDYREKDFDDEVYEDEYYEKHYDGEELEDESELLDEEKGRGELDEEDEEEDLLEEEEALDEGEWDDDEKKVTVSYACDECDYRWDDIVIRKKSELVEDEHDVICPMCGSMNVTLI